MTHEQSEGSPNWRFSFFLTNVAQDIYREVAEIYEFVIRFGDKEDLFNAISGNQKRIDAADKLNHMSDSILDHVITLFDRRHRAMP